MESFILKIKRGESPFFRFLRSVAKAVLTSNLPVPRFLFPILRVLFNLHNYAGVFFRRFVSYVYTEPLFRSRCEHVGRNFNLTRMPWVMSHAKIYIGEGVNFFGKVDIISGRIFDEPKLTICDRADIGHNVVFVVNKEIYIGEDVNIASGVRFMDSDAHPRDTTARIMDLAPPPEEVRPVRVERYAWIGQNVFILKGVTVGEGAVVGVNSVVVSDIPPYSVAMGNPARVIMKNVSKPVETAGSAAETA